MADYYVDENGKITRSKKKRTDYTVDESGKISIVRQEKEELKPSDFGTTKDDIAPVKEKSFLETAWDTAGNMLPAVAAYRGVKWVADAFSEGGWLKSSAQFDDGWQFGDITKTILGTAQDTATNALTGALDMGEKIVDAAVAIAPYLAQGQMNMNGSMIAPLEVQQMQQQAFAQSKESAAKFVEKDLYDAEMVAKKITSNSAINKWTDIDEEADSIFDEKADSLVQSAGQLGVQAAFSAIPGVGQVGGLALMGTTAFGGEAENALKNNATLDEAVFSGAVSAGAEILTEKLGGISFGGKTLTDAAFNRLSRHMTGQLSKILLTTGKIAADASAEGVEEILSGYMSAIGQKLSYMEEKEIEELFSSEDLLDSFIGGVVLGGAGGVGGAIKSAVNGVDYVTELTKNEQTVVDKVYKDRVAEAEKKGKISAAEKSKIYDDVLEHMEKGYLSTDDIESALGDRSAYDALQKESDEFKTLYETESGKLSKKQQDRLAELEAKNKATPYETALKDTKSKYSDSVFNLVRGENNGRGSKLLETYNEKARMGQDFQADFEKYKGTKHEEAARKTIESAIQAGANNTNRVHDLVDMAAQISADTGRTFYFKSGEQIKADFLERQQKIVAEMESIPKAKRTAEQTKKLTDLKNLITKVKSGEIKVNGDITEDGITLNLDSTKPLNRTVGHEVTHSLEKAKSYKELKESLFAYAKSKGIDIESELNTRKLMYEGITDANPEAELVSDLVGDFLFTDSNYIKKLSTENRNVFQKIWDEVKYLYSIATAGSQEARELAKVKKAFEDAYRESAEKNTADGGGSYSLVGRTADGLGIYKTNYPLNTPKSVKQADLIDLVQNVWSSKPITLTIVENGEYVDITAKFNPELSERSDLAKIAFGNRKGKAAEQRMTLDLASDLYQIAEESKFKYSKDAIPKPNNPAHDGVTKYHYFLTNLVYKDDSGNYIPSHMNIDVKRNGDGDWFYSFSIEKGSVPQALLAAGTDESATLPSANLPNIGDFVKRDYSLSDSDGKKLTKEQAEYFKDSKVRDRDGNLLKVYHTTKNDFTVFDDSRKGSNTYADNTYLGHFFTDNPDYMGEFPEFKDGKTEAYYLNMKNPIDMNNISKQAFLDIVEVTGGDVQEATELYDREYDAEVQRAKFRGDNATFPELSTLLEELTGEYYYESDFHEVLQPNYDKLLAKGYDGIINNMDGAGWANEYIVINSNQAKLTTNTNPTTDADTRYSLSSIANSFFGDENMTASEFRKADYRDTQGYKDYVEQCLNNYRQTRADFNEDEARKSIEDSIEGIVRVAIAAKQAGYDIYDDASKRSLKDSKNRLLFSSLEPNSDYFTSNDISTICDKRKNFAEIYDDIVRAEEAKGVPKGKRFFDNVDNYFAIHKIMADKGLTTPCRQCYVESMRKNLAPMANAFLRLVQETNPDNTSNDQLYHQSGKQKGGLKTSNASTREFVLSALASHPEYNMTVSDLSVEKLTTADGLAQIKIQAPLIYEAFNSFYGQSKPKMPKAATPFRFGELTALLTDEKGRVKQSLVDKINSTGGFRLQSYSDFQIQNYTDVLQVLFEAGTLGLNGHAYTKVPAFLDATKDTNLKRNISIFMYKDGDEWKLDKNDSFPYDLEEIYDLVKADKTGNTGIIAVSQNSDMSAWIMANDYVGYGIPFHKSGLKMGTVRDTDVQTDDGRIIKGYSGTIDHTKQQTEVWAKATEDHKALTKVKNGINIYSFWDFDNKSNLSKNELIEKNVKAYIDQCELAGYLPKFRAYVMNNEKVLNDVLKYSKELGFVSEDATISDISFQYKGYTIPYGYYKFLGDFGMFTPDGKAAGQKTLSLENYDFDKAVEFFSDAETLRRTEILQQFANGKERQKYRDSDLTAEELQEIVKQKRSEVVEDVVPGVQNSLSANGEQFTPSTNDVYGKDFRVQNPAQEIAPVAENATTVSETESVAPVAVSEKETTTEELFPDDTAPIQEEYEFLIAEREDIIGAIDAYTAVGDYESAERLMPEYEEVQTRLAEIEADEAERIASIEDSDAPMEVDNSNPEDVADDVPLTKTLVNDLAKEIKSKLGISNKRTAEVRDLIERYSKEEFPSKAHLYTEIAERFGIYTETEVNEELKGVKSLLRTYGIKVDDSIKKDIADYGQFMRSNFGKVRFSNEGLPVDVAYKEFQEALPGYFPERINVPSDQLLRIVEVANMDTTITNEYEIDWQTLEEATDTIMNTVGEFKQNRKEALANKHGRESFQSLLESADQYVPPYQFKNIAPTRAEMNAQPSPDDIAPVFDTGSGQQAFMPEAEVPKKVTRGELHENIVDNIKTTFREKGFEFDDVLKNAKDLSTFATVDNTPQRVLEKALGYKQGQVLSDLTVNKVAQNETEGIKWLNSFTDRKNGLLAKISEQYKIKPGSKASAAAQMYAEGFYVGENNAIIAYGDKELAADFPDVKVQENIKKLARDPRIRQIYDETLAAINESRTRNAYPEIPRLDNYFLHFRAMEDTFSRLGLPFNPNDIRAKDLPTDLNGVTADLKPGQPYFASAKHRMGKRTSFDLLGGLEKYLSSAKNQIYHIDDIQTLRALRNYVAETYGQAHGLENIDTMSDEEAEQRINEVYNSHLSTFAKFLNEEANVLAGKTSLIDRGLEGVIGRRGITFLDSLNKQVGANMVGFNVSSSLTNFLAPVQAFAKSNKFDFVKAMAQTAYNKVGSIFGKGDSFAEDSPVMIRRKGADRFYRTPFEKVGDAGYIFMSAVDDISTELVARTKYNELTRNGMDSQQAHYETDKWVSRLMGDRSLGQQPQLYNSKMLGLVTKFQLEVRNQLDSQFYDTIQEAKVSTEDIENGLLRNAKKAAKITSTFVQLAVVQHLFGKAFESVAGYNPAFDIIGAIIKAFGWDDEEESEDTVLDNIEQGFLELLGDLPYTSTLTGGRIPIESALPITELIKGEDRYGNEKSRWETLGEIAPYYILPGGYGQIKKTVQGLDMFSEDHPIAGSYTDSGNLRFPVEDTLGNRIQAGLFGQYASENARDYFDNERSSLKEKQIQEFIDVGMTIQDYWKYRDGLSKFDKLAEKADYINSLDLTTAQKNVLINNIADRKEDIDMSDYGNYSSFEEFDFAEKNPEKYSFLKENNVSYSQYKNFDDDTKNAYDWAFENPEKFTMSKAIAGDVATYRKYTKDLNEIKADKDSSGKTISGSRKEKVIDYINNLDAEYGEKIILYKSLYEADNTYNNDIVEYLNSRNDISYQDTVTILRELGFTVLSDGTVQW